MRIDVQHSGSADEWKDMLTKQLDERREAKLTDLFGHTSARMLEIERIAAARRGAGDPMIQAEAQERGLTAAQVVQEIVNEAGVRAQKLGVIAGLSMKAKDQIAAGNFDQAKDTLRALDNTI